MRGCKIYRCYFEWTGECKDINDCKLEKSIKEKKNKKIEKGLKNEGN